jgi:hypothetical protein
MGELCWRDVELLKLVFDQRSVEVGNIPVQSPSDVNAANDGSHQLNDYFAK